MEIRGSALIFLFVCAVYCSPADLNDFDMDADEAMQNDNENYGGAYDDTDETVEESKMLPNSPPEISTRAEQFIRDIGETVVLPCKISGSSSVVQMWRKGDNVLFQAEIKMAATSNMKLQKDGSLSISNLHPQDAGKYECMAMESKQNSPTIQHEVILRVPPQIDVLLAKNNITVLRNGDTLILTCRASGYPKPVISWHKGSSRFDIQGDVLEIQDVKHHDAGTYKCLADNKLGEPAFAYINIKVEYKPIITIDKISVSSDHNSETELECLVHAEPRAQVTWIKDGMTVANSDRVELKTSEHKHNLILKQIQESDFGVYTCLATNSLGSTQKNVSLVQTPVVHHFEKSQPENKVVLVWEVQSKTNVSAEELTYRKKEDTQWKKFQGEGKVETTHDGNDIYEVKYTFNKGLEPGEYHLRFRSQNQKDWSEVVAKKITIEVVAKHGHHKPHKKGHKHGKERQVTPTPTLPSQPAESTEQETEHKSGFIKESPPSAAATDSSSLATPRMLLISIAMFVLFQVRLASMRI